MTYLKGRGQRARSLPGDKAWREPECGERLRTPIPGVKTQLPAATFVPCKYLAVRRGLWPYLLELVFMLWILSKPWNQKDW